MGIRRVVPCLSAVPGGQAICVTLMQRALCDRWAPCPGARASGLGGTQEQYPGCELAQDKGDKALGRAGLGWDFKPSPAPALQRQM